MNRHTDYSAPGYAMHFSPSGTVQAELGATERLLWADQPAQGLKLRSSDVFMIPFSLMWGGFALFWEYSVLQDGAPLFALLWGIPFVLIGLHMLVGRFFTDARIRKNTFYGLTDERIVIISGWFKKRVTSINLRTLDEVSLSEHSDGSGTIVFGNAPLASASMSGLSLPGANQPQTPRFEFIKDARTVYEQIRAAQKDAAQSTGD